MADHAVGRVDRLVDCCAGKPCYEHPEDRSNDTVGKILCQALDGCAGNARLVERRGIATHDVRYRFAPTLASRFADPTPLAGYFNLNTTDARDACPASVDVAGRQWCIVPCEPPGACAGDNFCAAGYRSVAPMYRCASCAAGYFRRAAECVKCPGSPVALAISFVLVVLALAGTGYVLNKKGVQVAFGT